MSCEENDLVMGSVGVSVAITVESSDPSYTFADVTSVDLKLRRGPNEWTRTGLPFAVIGGDLIAIYVTEAGDLTDKGSLYFTPLLNRPAGLLPAEERSLLVGT